jgi:Rps23 Pro-64 3,4-dihydroxylase Tpa1-like proline 4-hydroxylase
MILSTKNIEIEKEYARNAYKIATPFPHVTIDNLFDKYFLENTINDIKDLDRKKWWEYNNIFEKKYAYNNFQNMGKSLQEYFNFVNGNYFTKFLEQVTCINNLIADPSLYGGGIHKIIQGGKLDIHEDFNYHKITGWKRKINVITFLNKEWKETYGGHTEFWNKDMTKCCSKILPVFNRTIIFCTDQDSFHGHPEPLNCPDHMERLSLATYYYVFEKLEIDNQKIMSTTYKKRPSDITNEDIEKLRIARSEGRLKK